MFSDGLVIMILGMGIVFFFLFIIYLTVFVTSTLIEEFHLKTVPIKLDFENTEVKEKKEKDDDSVLAVISAAVYYVKKK